MEREGGAAPAGCCWSKLLSAACHGCCTTPPVQLGSGAWLPAWPSSGAGLRQRAAGGQRRRRRGTPPPKLTRWPTGLRHQSPLPGSGCAQGTVATLNEYSREWTCTHWACLSSLVVDLLKPALLPALPSPPHVHVEEPGGARRLMHQHRVHCSVPPLLPRGKRACSAGNAHRWWCRGHRGRGGAHSAEMLCLNWLIELYTVVENWEVQPPPLLATVVTCCDASWNTGCRLREREGGAAGGRAGQGSWWGSGRRSRRRSGLRRLARHARPARLMQRTRTTAHQAHEQRRRRRRCSRESWI